MAERISESLQKKLSGRLSFYEDLGIGLFYRDRGEVGEPDFEGRLEPPDVAHHSTIELQKEETLPKPSGKPALQKTAPAVAPVSAKIASLPVAAGPSLFESGEKIAGDTLLKIREDLGECTRCKLHSTRQKIAGDVSPRLFAAQSTGEKRSLERSPKSHVRARPRSEERQVRLTHHGNSAGLADRADLGRRGFHCAFFHASHWRFAFHVVHATDGFSSALVSSPRSRRVGAPRGLFRMAA